MFLNFKLKFVLQALNNCYYESFSLCFVRSVSIVTKINNEKKHLMG